MLLEDGEAWMTGSTWRGRKILRISVSNWSTTADDVDRSLAAVRRVRRRPRRRPGSAGSGEEGQGPGRTGSAGGEARDGSGPSGSPSAPTGTGPPGVGGDLDPRAGEHGDLGQVDVAAVVHLRQRADQLAPGRGLDAPRRRAARRRRRRRGRCACPCRSSPEFATTTVAARTPRPVPSTTTREARRDGTSPARVRRHTGTAAGRAASGRGRRSRRRARRRRRRPSRPPPASGRRPPSETRSTRSECPPAARPRHPAGSSGRPSIRAKSLPRPAGTMPRVPPRRGDLARERATASRRRRRRPRRRPGRRPRPTRSCIACGPGE